MKKKERPESKRSSFLLGRFWYNRRQTIFLFTSDFCFHENLGSYPMSRGQGVRAPRNRYSSLFRDEIASSDPVVDYFLDRVLDCVSSIAFRISNANSTRRIADVSAYVL